MTIPVWHDRERSILIYDTPKPLDIARVVPNSFQLYNGYVGVPITLQNLQRLRSIDYPVIAPMEDRYDWPGLYTPFMAQRGTSNFLTLHPRAFCLNDMGTGKTLACLWAADYVMLQHPPKTFKWLIVAPLSTLRTVWGDAIFQNFMGRRSYSVLHGTAAQREAALARDVDFYIINHDGLGVGFGEKNRKPELRSLAAMLANRGDIQGVIIDECSAYRDATTRRHKVARHLLGQRAYLWLLSGTPTANGPLDAYGQAKLVNGAYGESFTHYKTRVMMQVSQFKWMPKAGSDVEAKKLLSPAVRYKISDCIDLPPCTVQHREAPLSTEQMQYYKQMKTQLKLELKKGAQVNAVSEGVLRMKLIQIACGAVYDGEHVAHHLDAKPRLAVLQELIDACQDKMIIFAPLTSVVNMVHDFIPGSVIVNGSVKPKDRTEIFRAFQQDDFPRYMVADPHTMAHGVTLTAATTIVWFAPIDKTEIYLQANKRIDRPGQTKNTTIVQISSTPVEREIYRRLEANESMQGAILKLAE